MQNRQGIFRESCSAQRQPIGLVLLALLAGLFFAASVSGAVLRVPADYATIQDAINAAADGDIIRVQPGTYNESLVFGTAFSVNGLTIVGTDAANLPVITGGVRFRNSGAISGITFKLLALSGAAAGANSVFEMDNAGAVSDFTMNRCLIDGGNVSGRHGFRGRNLTGNFTMLRNEFRNILGKKVVDTDTNTGTGGNALPFHRVLFNSNYIHHSNGGVLLRGNPTTRTDTVRIRKNTWENIGGNAAELGDHRNALRVNHAEYVQVVNNTVNTVLPDAAGLGRGLSFGSITKLRVHHNHIDNADEGIFLYTDIGNANIHTNNIFNSGRFGVRAKADGVPVAGGVFFNNILGSGQAGVKVNFGATRFLDATDNWWGDVNGPSGGASDPLTGAVAAGASDAVSNNVHFDPWVGKYIPSDNNAPTCQIIAINPGPPLSATVVVRDGGSGLAAIDIVHVSNATVDIPIFPVGTSDPITVILTKIDQSRSATVVLGTSDLAGNQVHCDPVYTTLSAVVPDGFELKQNYPNPFNPTTTIAFDVVGNPGSAATVSMKIYDILGREVRTLLNESMQPGRHSLVWDGTNNAGQAVAGGVYFYRMVVTDHAAGAQTFTATKKMLLVK